MSIVISCINGGLGNQFFQYAAGRAIALRHGARYRLRIDNVKSDRYRPYWLDQFPIQATPATQRELDLFESATTVFKQRGLIKSLVRRLAKRGTVFNERAFHFSPEVLGATPPLLLAGYWITERYFRAISDTIRRELTPIAPLEPDNERMRDDIRQSMAISVHIRRGDYVSSPVTAAHHGLVSLAYYRRAMDYVAARVSDPVFFVFSDDPSWAHDNLRHSAPIRYVTINGNDRPYRDVQLMSACRHHIIANSTFSWWGAWLNPAPDKIVISPMPWFLAGNYDLRDVLPPGWIAMPSDGREPTVALR